MQKTADAFQIKKRDKANVTWGDKQADSLWNNLYARYRPLIKNKVVLDFGCSWGYMCKYILDNFEPRKVVGVDISAFWENTDHGWDWRSEGDRLSFHPGDVRDIDAIEPGSVDVILCTSVLQYLRPEQLEGSLDKLYSLLRPGGEFLLRTRTFMSYIGSDLHHDFSPPFVHLFYSKRYLEDFLEKRDGRPPRYLNPLTASTYLMMFQRAGFEIADVRRRRGKVSDEWVDRLKSAYPYISENELLCAELEARLIRPYEIEELDAITSNKKTKGVVPSPQ